MDQIERHDDYAQRIVDQYFNDALTVRVKGGELLLRQGELNYRLFCIRSGHLVGLYHHDDGSEEEVMRAGPGDLVGVISFFSPAHHVAFTLRAMTNTVLACIERKPDDRPSCQCMEHQLMPLVVDELTRRQRLLYDMAKQQQEVSDKLHELEQVSFLGQLAAGVAHELNNALAILVRGTGWLDQLIEQQAILTDMRFEDVYMHGRQKGRHVSTTESRERASALQRQYGLTASQSRKLSQTGLSDDRLHACQDLSRDCDAIYQAWELGATFYDLQLAAGQAKHVVESMKQLGARDTMRQEVVDINETISASLQLLRHSTRGIQVEINPGDLSPMKGNRGEFIQIWTNLIRNACEALHMSESKHDKRIMIRSSMEGDRYMIEVEDNGPGIADAMLPHLFEPSYTTRKSGLNFGLGLGLSIVKQLVTGYGGEVSVRHVSPGVVFTVTLPRGVES